MTPDKVKELREAIEEIKLDIALLKRHHPKDTLIKAEQLLLDLATQVLEGKLIEPASREEIVRIFQDLADALIGKIGRGREEILGIMARVYTYPQHYHKILDADLLNDIATALTKGET